MAADAFSIIEALAGVERISRGAGSPPVSRIILYLDAGVVVVNEPHVALLQARFVAILNVGTATIEIINLLMLFVHVAVASIF